MNNQERNMLIEVYRYSDIVPNVRNNCSMKDLSRYRFDAMELMGYISKLCQIVIEYSQPLAYYYGDQEDMNNNKAEMKKEFEEYLNELKKFKETREKENHWSAETQYQYRYGRGGW